MTPEQYKKLTKEKNEQLFFAIEAVEGRLMSVGEAQQFMFIRAARDKPREETVIWRLKPLLHFMWNGDGELKTLKLYEEKKS